jgi:hypothetical protein
VPVADSSSSASLGLRNYSQVDMLGLRYKPVNFGAEKSLGSVLGYSGQFVNSGLIYYTMYVMVGACHDIKDAYHDMQTLYKLAFSCHGRCIFISSYAPTMT